MFLKKTCLNLLPVTPCFSVLRTRRFNLLISSMTCMVGLTVQIMTFSHLSLSVCLSVSRISHKVGDGFRLNLVNSLGVCVTRTNWLDFGEDLAPRIFFNDSSPLRDGTKNDMLHDILKSCGHFTTKPGGWVGEVTRTNRFNFGSGPDPDPSSQWDAKCKLFSRAEVWAQLSDGSFMVYLFRL